MTALHSSVSLVLDFPAEVSVGSAVDFVSCNGGLPVAVGEVVNHIEVGVNTSAGVLAISPASRAEGLLEILMSSRAVAVTEDQRVSFDVRPEGDMEVIERFRVPNVDMVLRAGSIRKESAPWEVPMGPLH